MKSLQEGRGPTLATGTRNWIEENARRRKANTTKKGERNKFESSVAELKRG